MKQIILASASPRRKDLLEQIGLTFEVIPSTCEEVSHAEHPADVVIELSKQKAKDIWDKLQDRQQDILVIGADTVVAYEQEILGKPKDFDDAKRMLELLSGKEHHVYTGVTLLWIDASGKREEYSFYVCTGVTMYRIGKAEIMDYVFFGRAYGQSRGICSARKRRCIYQVREGRIQQRGGITYRKTISGNESMGFAFIAERKERRI